MTSKILRSPSWLGWPLWNICVTNDHGYAPFVVNTFRSFPRSWLITGFVTRLKWRVPLVEQELPTLPDHLSSPPTFGGVRVTRSLVLYVCFVDHCLSFCIYFFIWPLCCLFFDIRILITLWYRKTLLIKVLPQRSLEFSCYSIFLSYSMWHWRYFAYLWWFLLFQLIMNHANHMVSLPVFVCAVVLTIPSSVRLLLFVFMCQNFICWCCPHSWSETIQHNTYYIHGINCRSRR
jgi:hypothetical protein